MAVGSIITRGDYAKCYVKKFIATGSGGRLGRFENLADFKIAAFAESTGTTLMERGTNTYFLKLKGMQAGLSTKACLSHHTA
jgi:hypothetical protein